MSNSFRNCSRRTFSKVIPYTKSALADFAQDNDLHILLLMDEAEKLLDFTTEYLENLRSVLNRSPNLRAVITATKTLGELNNRNWRNSSLLHYFQFKYLPPFSEDAIDDLIGQSQNRQGPLKIEPGIQKEIKRHTGGHPYLIQWLCDCLYVNGKGQLHHVIDKKFLVVDDPLRSLFQIDYNGLSQSERRILHHLTEKERQEKELLRVMSIPQTRLESFLYSLEQLGFIRQKAEQYAIANTFLLKWLQEKEWEEITGRVSDETTLEIAKKTASEGPSIRNSKNTVLDSTVKAGGNIHIGDIHINQITQHPQEGFPESLPDKQIVEFVRDKVAKSQIKSAIEELLKYVKERQSELLNEVIAISSQWNGLSGNERMGVLERGAGNIERNKIIKALLDICDQLET